MKKFMEPMQEMEELSAVEMSETFVLLLSKSISDMIRDDDTPAEDSAEMQSMLFMELVFAEMLSSLDKDTLANLMTIMGIELRRYLAKAVQDTDLIKQMVHNCEVSIPLSEAPDLKNLINLKTRDKLADLLKGAKEHSVNLTKGAYDEHKNKEQKENKNIEVVFGVGHSDKVH